MDRLPAWVRWVCVLPAAVMSMYAVGLVNVVTAYFTEVPNRISELAVSAMGPTAFILAGAIMAPAAAGSVVILLAIIHTCGIVVLGLWMSSEGLIAQEGLDWWWNLFTLGLLGTGAKVWACICVWRRQKRKRKGATHSRPDEGSQGTPALSVKEQPAPQNSRVYAYGFEYVADSSAGGYWLRCPRCRHDLHEHPFLVGRPPSWQRYETVACEHGHASCIYCAMGEYPALHCPTCQRHAWISALPWRSARPRPPKRRGGRRTIYIHYYSTLGETLTIYATGIRYSPEAYTALKARLEDPQADHPGAPVGWVSSLVFGNPYRPTFEVRPQPAPRLTWTQALVLAFWLILSLGVWVGWVVGAAFLCRLPTTRWGWLLADWLVGCFHELP